MISFKEFILERIRTDKEAIKLGTYLTKRYERARPGKTIPYPRIGLKDDENSFRAWKTYNNAASQSPDKRIFNKPYIKKQDIPMHLIRPAQDHVEFNADYVNKHGFTKDKRRIKVVQQDGYYYPIDGHHRWINRRLKGQEKHMKSFVYDPKDVGIKD